MPRPNSGREEQKFASVYGIRKVFLSLCLSEGCIKLYLCCISKLELIALCMITTLLLEYLKEALTFNKILCGDLILLIESSNQRTRAKMFGDRSEYESML